MAEAQVCLRAQRIDDDDGVVNRVIKARGLSDDNGGVGRGQGIDRASEGLVTTTDTYRVQGQPWRPWRRNDGTEKFATNTEALAEEDDPKVSTTTTEASDEE